MLIYRYTRLRTRLLIAGLIYRYVTVTHTAHTAHLRYVLRLRTFTVYVHVWLRLRLRDSRSRWVARLPGCSSALIGCQFRFLPHAFPFRSRLPHVYAVDVTVPHHRGYLTALRCRSYAVTLYTRFTHGYRATYRLPRCGCVTCRSTPHAALRLRSARSRLRFAATFTLPRTRLDCRYRTRLVYGWLRLFCVCYGCGSVGLPVVVGWLLRLRGYVYVWIARCWFYAHHAVTRWLRLGYAHWMPRVAVDSAAVATRTVTALRGWVAVRIPVTQLYARLPHTATTVCLPHAVHGSFAPAVVLRYCTVRFGCGYLPDYTATLLRITVCLPDCHGLRLRLPGWFIFTRLHIHCVPGCGYRTHTGYLVMVHLYNRLPDAFLILVTPRLRLRYPLPFDCVTRLYVDLPRLRLHVPRTVTHTVTVCHRFWITTFTHTHTFHTLHTHITHVCWLRWLDYVDYG